MRFNFPLPSKYSNFLPTHKPIDKKIIWLIEYPPTTFPTAIFTKEERK